MGVLDGPADLRAGQVGHHQLAGVAMQLDSPTTDLQPEGVHGAGRRLTFGPVLAPRATFARPPPLARRTPPLARASSTFATRTTAPFAPRTTTASTPFATRATTTLTTRTPAASTPFATRATTTLATGAAGAAAAIASLLASTGPAPLLAARAALSGATGGGFACRSPGALPTTTPPTASSPGPAGTLRGGV